MIVLPDGEDILDVICGDKISGLSAPLTTLHM